MKVESRLKKILSLAVCDAPQFSIDADVQLRSLRCIGSLANVTHVSLTNPIELIDASTMTCCVCRPSSTCLRKTLVTVAIRYPVPRIAMPARRFLMRCTKHRYQRARRSLATRVFRRTSLRRRFKSATRQSCASVRLRSLACTFPNLTPFRRSVSARSFRLGNSNNRQRFRLAPPTTSFYRRCCCRIVERRYSPLLPESYSSFVPLRRRGY